MYKTLHWFERNPNYMWHINFLIGWQCHSVCQEFIAKQRQTEKDYSEIIPAERAKGKNLKCYSTDTPYYLCNALWKQVFALESSKTAHCLITFPQTDQLLCTRAQEPTLLDKQDVGEGDRIWLKS